MADNFRTIGSNDSIVVGMILVLIDILLQIIIFKIYFLTAISNEKLKLYGVQFHPEVDLTRNGKQVLKNFLYDISGLTGTFTMHSREVECIDYIKKCVGNCKVLVSGTFIHFMKPTLFHIL